MPCSLTFLCFAGSRENNRRYVKSYFVCALRSAISDWLRMVITAI
jgi:hypothetical protein